MKRIVNSRIVLAGILAVAGLPNLHAQRGCSNASLSGAYGFYSTGTVLPARTPRITVGLEVYDENGNFSNTFTVNDNGAVSHNGNSGTYHVNPDCTGTIFTALEALQLRLDFVIADGGNEIDFLVGSNPAILDVYGVRKIAAPPRPRRPTRLPSLNKPKSCALSSSAPSALLAKGSISRSSCPDPSGESASRPQWRWTAMD
jgi:hypothetical protein